MTAKIRENKIKNWEKENERLEKKMYKLYKWDFAKRRKAVLDLLKTKKIKTAEL